MTTNKTSADKIEFADDSMDLSDDLLCELASAMNDNDNDATIPQKESKEEQCLSQKLSQLSTFDDNQNKQSKDSTTITPITTATTTTAWSSSTQLKNYAQKVYDEELDGKIPSYLSMNDQDFQKLCQSLLLSKTKTVNSMTMKDLQEIALHLRQIAMVDVQQSLWNTYLQSGTGELEKEHRLSAIQQRHPHKLFLWPMEMKSSMINNNNNNNKKKKNYAEITKIDMNHIDHETCLNYARGILLQFADRKRQYQRQLYEKKHRFEKCFTSKMEDTLSQLIERREMVFIRLQFESKITIVNYDYRDRLFELEYHQFKPNQYQLDLFENLTRAKQEMEKSKYEVEMLKQRLHYHYLPEPLNSLQLPPLPPLEDTIVDSKIRQDILDRYKDIGEQTKSEMVTLYISIAKAQMHQCQLKFDQMTIQMKSNPQQLTPSMINIIEQRFKNIDGRLLDLYTLKIRFLEEQQNK